MHLHRAPPASCIRHVIRGIRYNWAIVLRVPVFKILRRHNHVHQLVVLPMVHVLVPAVLEPSRVMDIIRVVVPVHVRGVHFGVHAMGA